MLGNCSAKRPEKQVVEYGYREQMRFTCSITSTTAVISPQLRRIWGTHSEGKVKIVRGA